MRRRLHEHLRTRPDGAAPDELLPLVFASAGRDPGFGRRFLDTLLGQDPRFRWDDAAGRWRACLHDVVARPLTGLSFVVLDIETTGGGPAEGGITEIGAVRVVDGRLTDEFQTLVNPGRPIPAFVQALTGITDAMVADAPPIAEVLPRFLAFAGDGVLVAHNARFDLGHLGLHHARLLGRPLEAPSLCTIRLSRRLLPELRRRSLDHVAGALGIACHDRHRGLADARITAEILCVLLERAAARGVTTLEALLALERAAADGRPFVVHVPRSRLDAAPSTPGVYHLLGADGRPLYVGKAARLRERLHAWFTNAKGHRARQLEMLRQVHDVRWTETGSELAAALLEARQIQELKPPCNQLARQLPRVAFVKLGLRGGFPRLWTTQRLGSDRALYLGPFASRDAADRAATVLARTFGLRTCAGALRPSPDVEPCAEGRSGACPAPCAARIDAVAYGARVEACLAFVDGLDDGPVEVLAARGAAEAAARHFETAARARRDLAVLEDVRRRRRLGWVVQRQNFAVLLPTADRESAQLYTVLGGRLALEARIDAASDLVLAVRLVRERWDRWQGRPLGRGDVPTSTILAAWLRDRAQEGLLLPLDGPESLAARFDELTVTLSGLRQRGPLPAIDGLG